MRGSFETKRNLTRTPFYVASETRYAGEMAVPTTRSRVSRLWRGVDNPDSLRLYNFAEVGGNRGRRTIWWLIAPQIQDGRHWKSNRMRPCRFSLDRMIPCLQYCPNVFEGMHVCYSGTCTLWRLLFVNSSVHFDQAHMEPDGEIRLFRPNKDMEPLAHSAARVAIPVSSLSLPPVA